MLDVLLLKSSRCQMSGLHRFRVIFGPLDYLHVGYQVSLVKHGSLCDPISSLILHCVCELVTGHVVPLYAAQGLSPSLRLDILFQLPFLDRELLELSEYHFPLVFHLAKFLIDLRILKGLLEEALV
jgi:hypothetical protein